jgi:hypothetical protein
MNDLVERLKGLRSFGPEHFSMLYEEVKEVSEARGYIIDEKIAEIDRLAAENAQLREALNVLNNTSISSTPEWGMSDNNGEIWSMFINRIVTTALAKVKEEK